MVEQIFFSDTILQINMCMQVMKPVKTWSAAPNTQTTTPLFSYNAFFCNIPLLQWKVSEINISSELTHLSNVCQPSKRPYGAVDFVINLGCFLQSDVGAPPLQVTIFYDWSHRPCGPTQKFSGHEALVTVNLVLATIFKKIFYGFFPGIFDTFNGVLHDA